MNRESLASFSTNPLISFLYSRHLFKPLYIMIHAQRAEAYLRSFTTIGRWSNHDENSFLIFSYSCVIFAVSGCISFFKFHSIHSKFISKFKCNIKTESSVFLLKCFWRVTLMHNRLQFGRCFFVGKMIRLIAFCRR